MARTSSWCVPTASSRRCGTVTRPATSSIPWPGGFQLRRRRSVAPEGGLTTNYNSFSFQSNPSAAFGAIDPTVARRVGNGNHIADEFNFGLTIRPGLADDFIINTGVSFTSFDSGLANAIFQGNGNVTSFLLRLTTTY